MPRIVFRDQETSAEIAKAIRKHLISIGIDVKHYYCLQLCARMFGYRNHIDLLAEVSHQPSPPDLDVTPRGTESAEHPVYECVSEIRLDGRTGLELDHRCKEGAWLGIGRVMPKMPLIHSTGANEES